MLRRALAAAGLLIVALQAVPTSNAQCTNVDFDGNMGGTQCQFRYERPEQRSSDETISLEEYHARQAHDAKLAKGIAGGLAGAVVMVGVIAGISAARAQRVKAKPDVMQGTPDSAPVDLSHAESPAASLGEWVGLDRQGRTFRQKGFTLLDKPDPSDLADKALRASQRKKLLQKLEALPTPPLRDLPEWKRAMLEAAQDFWDAMSRGSLETPRHRHVTAVTSVRG